MVEMPRTAPGPDRYRLGFADAVSDAFGFLLGRGFQLVELSETFAPYEAARRFVQVSHGRGSYELGVEIGRWTELDGVPHEQLFSLRDVVSLTTDPAAIGFGGTSATTAETVRKFITRLAAWTQEYASPLISDGEDLFQALRARNSAWFDAEQDAQRARLLRSRADEAWRARDFANVVNAYTELDRELTTVELRPSERGRLAYALKALKD
jgi:hypothetical protein